MPANQRCPLCPR